MTGPRRHPARHRLFAAAAAGLALACVVPAAGAVPDPPAPRTSPALPLPPAPAPPAFFAVDDLRSGMKGVGRTVFAGPEIEEFQVEILGVLRNAIGPQQHLILARLHGDKVEHIGVAAGMSGSPIYVDGKLVGALAYRIGPFGKEAIAGITPIADMVKLAPAPSRAAVPAPADLLGPFLASDRSGVRPARDAGRLATTTAGTGGGVGPGGGIGKEAFPPGGLQPIAVPLLCSGCDGGVLRYYAPIFEGMGLEPAAGGGVVSGAAAMPLLPGSAVGAALVTGDISVVGIGTLTHVDRGRVFAFGHPLLGAGRTEIPMTQAQVITTFASAQASFKVANSTSPVGTIVQDGLTAIVGEVGKVAPTIPVTVRVGQREFHYEILRHRAWAPVLLALTAANSLTRTTDYESSASLSVRCRLGFEGHGEVSFEELYTGINPLVPVHLQVANDVGSVFGLLYNNRFEEPRVTLARLEVEMLPEARVAFLTGLRASRTDVHPGETFTVTATLQDFRGAERQVAWPVVLPEDTPAGDTEISVGGGPAIDALDRRILERQLAQAASLDDLVRLAGTQRRNDVLYLRVSRRAPAAVVRSSVLPDLPLSVFSVLNNPRLSADSTLMTDAPILDMARDLDVAVAGGRRITVRVK